MEGDLLISENIGKSFYSHRFVDEDVSVPFEHASCALAEHEQIDTLFGV